MARLSASSFFIPRTLIGPSVTFSRMVLWAKRLNDWKTIPTSARSLARSLPSWGSGWPSSEMVPSLIVSRRLIARQSVDLPDPDGPITTTTSPLLMERLMSWRTCRSPNHLSTWSRTTNGPVDLGEEIASAAAVMEVTVATSSVDCLYVRPRSAFQYG